MKIGQSDTSERVFIVAELGNNHEGNLATARRMVEEAAAAGVDAVKMQTFRTEGFTSPVDAARYARLKSFELPREGFRELDRLARSLGIGFFSTPLDLDSAAFLAPFVDAIKIASSDNDFWPLLDLASSFDRPMIVSTGMCDLEDVEKTVAFVRAARERHGRAEQLAILHCVSAYPASDADANVRAIPLLARRLGVPVGYSDHTLGPEACLAAVSLGARIIEKHFTLDKNASDFRDHKLSADPAEMRALVTSIRRVETLLGLEEKRVREGEKPVIAAARRSVVARAPMAMGHVVSGADLCWLRPGDGLRVGREGELVGRRLVRSIAASEALRSADVE
jgi:sialic acid synthase SpsE